MNYQDLFDPGKLTSITGSAAILGVMGAVMGDTVAAIENTQKAAKGERQSAEAVANVAKEALGTGMSTAAAAAAMAALGIGGLLGLAGFAAVATISKGFLDSVLYSEKNRPASNV